MFFFAPWGLCVRFERAKGRGSSAKKYGLTSGISKSWFMKSPLYEPQWLAIDGGRF